MRTSMFPAVITRMAREESTSIYINCSHLNRPCILSQKVGVSAYLTFNEDLCSLHSTSETFEYGAYNNILIFFCSADCKRYNKRYDCKVSEQSMCKMHSCERPNPLETLVSVVHCPTDTRAALTKADNLQNIKKWENHEAKPSKRRSASDIIFVNSGHCPR